LANWYESAFGAHYIELYAHRDEKDAQRAVDFVLRRTGADALAGRPALDLCCGAARHSLELLRRCAPVLASLDLSSDLLVEAKRVAGRCGIPLQLFRGDMRQLPFAPDSFHLVLNLFTSFGYFTDDAQNEAVMAGIARVLRPGGKLILDHMNPPYLLANLKTESCRATPSGLLVFERRSIDRSRRRVEKHSSFFLEWATRESFESVRFYTPEEMTALAARFGLVLGASYGDFDDSPLTPQSPRAIYVFLS
jgi:SAM-dependent methyltransferase